MGGQRNDTHPRYVCGKIANKIGYHLKITNYFVQQWNNDNCNIHIPHEYVSIHDSVAIFAV